jgi:uncharacterized membrane protein
MNTNNAKGPGVSWLQVALVALPFLVLVPLWDKFPATVPIHWGIDGRVNGWASKEVGLLLLPAITLAASVLTAYLPMLDRRVRDQGPEKQESFRDVVRVISLATTAFMSGMALLVDAVALGWKIDVLFVVSLGTLLLFALLGNYMPKLRPNRYVGIRTPWTLKSPEVWTRTHRLFGRIMLWGSLALVPFCLLLPSPFFLALLLIYLLVISFGSMIYSYRCSRSLPGA